MKTIDWAASYASARQLLRNLTGKEPAPEQIWSVAVTALCIQYTDLKYEGVSPNSEPDKKTVIVVRYRGRFIILVFEGQDLIYCYLDQEWDDHFACLQDAMKEIDRQMDVKPVPAPEPESSFGP